MLLKKILVPYDGSSLSNKAIKNAIRIANLEKDPEIILIQVVEEIPVPPTWENRPFRSYITGDPITKYQFFKDINTEKILNTTKDLNKIKARYAVSKSKPIIKIKVLTGRPADKIIEFAEKTHVDLIIIGSIGKKGISGFFRGLGSVSRKVAESVSCNVLIVR